MLRSEYPRAQPFEMICHCQIIDDFVNHEVVSVKDGQRYHVAFYKRPDTPCNFTAKDFHGFRVNKVREFLNNLSH